jgi:hypothetical protein
MLVGALTIEIHLPDSGSLKEKRSVVKHLLETSKKRYGVASSEVGYQELWQRSVLGFAAVSGDAGQVESVLDTVERFVWSHPEIQVLGVTRHWLDTDD